MTNLFDDLRPAERGTLVDVLSRIASKIDRSAVNIAGHRPES